jgi:Kef-type K+ transport system membrane component KefB
MALSRKEDFIMERIFTIAALWLGLAVIPAVIAYHLKVSIALVEICVGVIMAAVAGYFGKFEALGSTSEWLRFLASSGAVLLTFLAGALVSLPALISAHLVFMLLLAGKVVSKIFGLYPVVGQFRHKRNERWYYTLMMSTGLTFGAIAALYGLTHNIVTQGQYLFLVAVVIASAVVPTMIAGFAFLPKRLLPEPVPSERNFPRESDPGAEG